MGITLDSRKDILNDKVIVEPLKGDGVQGNITVGTTAVEAKVGASALTNRGNLSVQPKDNSVYYGYTNAVTTSTGTRIFKNQTVWFDVSDSTTVYLIADGAGKDVRITEVAFV